MRSRHTHPKELQLRNQSHIRTISLQNNNKGGYNVGERGANANARERMQYNMVKLSLT